MKKIIALSKKELKVITGGSGSRFLEAKKRRLSLEEVKNLGWEDEGPNGDQYFPG